MAIDEQGNYYLIDEEVLKEHGTKVPKENFSIGFNISPGDVQGQSDWPVCSWKAHVNCGGE